MCWVPKCWLGVWGQVGNMLHSIIITTQGSLAPEPPSWLTLNMFLHLSVPQFMMCFYFLNVVRFKKRIFQSALSLMNS